jgi:putative endonuclease
MRAKDILGRLGEDAAAEHLGRMGWVIIDRNWRCAEGELDIVARDGPELVVCEVKTRSSTGFGTPAEAVTPAKATRLRRLADRWLAAHGIRTSSVRIDIVGLVAVGRGRFSIDHHRGVC